MIFVTGLGGRGSVAVKGNGLVLMGPGPAAHAHIAEMQKRLADPELRKQLVAETRAQMVSMNPDMAARMRQSP
jgi:hypothetical protein